MRTLTHAKLAILEIPYERMRNFMRNPEEMRLHWKKNIDIKSKPKFQIKPEWFAKCLETLNHSKIHTGCPKTLFCTELDFNAKEGKIYTFFKIFISFCSFQFPGRNQYNRISMCTLIFLIYWYFFLFQGLWEWELFSSSSRWNSGIKNNFKLSEVFHV